MTKKTPAKAAPKPFHIDGGKTIPMRVNGLTAPCLVYEGDKPDVGAKITATLANGVTYAGVVAAVIDADGKVLIEFKDGLTPV